MSGDKYLPALLDPVLQSVRDKFNLNEEFRVFLERNEDVRNARPDIGFLLFLIEQQREAFLNLEQRMAMLEKDGYVDRYIAKPLEVDHVSRSTIGESSQTS